MNTIDEAIEVLQGIKDGKAIQSALEGYKWEDRDDTYNNDLPDFHNLNYRVKPEPLEFWVNVYPHGSACLHETEKLAIQHRSDGVSRTIKVIEVIE